MKQKQEELKKQFEEKKEVLDIIKSEMSKIIVGQKKLIDMLLIALLTRGHILLEGVPGLAKTTAISTLSKIVSLDFKRIQFTPDLLPSDLIGSKIFNQKDSTFYIKRGPIFANFVLADEINRSPAKVQSALLEAMQERQVTIGEETFSMADPFLIMATQNPIENEGTYTLPEAQVDRFLIKTIVDYPSRDEELKIIEKSESLEVNVIKACVKKQDILALQDITKNVYMDSSIKKYIIDIVFSTRYPEKMQIKNNNLNKLISYGASPRASIGLMQVSKANAILNNRTFVTPEDIKEVAMDVLRHRVAVTYEAEAENIRSEQIIQTILDNVKVP